jgi:rhamnulokinase
MAERGYLAIDMGASSGRHVAGFLGGDKLRLEEVYRFENSPVNAGGHLQWDLLGLWSQVKQGLRAAATRIPELVSIGIDTWGVDFALLGRNDELLGNPYCYRDSRTAGIMNRAFAVVPREQIFAHTGLQFMEINTLYQLLAMKLANSSLLDAAESFLMIPDLFHWLLTGVKTNEFTNATTTQCFDPHARNWAYDLLNKLCLPTRLFQGVSPPGTRLGGLQTSVVAETGLQSTQVILPGTHDTASAVLAVPFTGAPSAKPNWCYISSGTWSLMGVEVPEPVINSKCLDLNFTNEGGVGGTIRLLKNIGGLWLVQECRRIWNQQGQNYSWEDLTRFAAAAKPLASFINPDAPEFLAPSNMPEAIRTFCMHTGQSAPNDAGSIIRAAIESLALRYRRVLGWLEELTGGKIETIQIVGGGAHNKPLCQATADACQRRVIAGPVEATAIGNVLMQAITLGDIGSIAQARKIVAESFAVETYEPQNAAAWDEAFTRFVKISEPV